MRTFEEVCERVAKGGDFPGGVTTLGLKKTEVLLSTLEMLVSFATSIHLSCVPAQKLRNINQIVESVRQVLETDTYRVFMDLRKPEHTRHPLRRLWARWKICKEVVDKRYRQ